jgi:CRISPR-associated protein (TIGR03986 family)
MITAPFNFVPLNEKVFFPSWSDDVSHDIPFSDGESGEIDITITAKSPIFIRDSVNSEQFCNHNGQYYIPSSSIKGMVRSVLEIMSFSKMSFIDDTTYSVRDLKYQKYMDEAKNVKCGWLYYDNGTLKLEDCGEPYRIKYDEINRYFGIEFKRNFMQGTFNNANSPYKKAYEKYTLLTNLTTKDILNESFNFELESTDRAGRKISNLNDNGSLEGKLVLTGHPSPRREPQNENGKKSGKILDFIFEKLPNPTLYDIDKKVFDNFKFAYFDGRTTQPTESPDWGFWKQRLNDGGRVPVFFHKGSQGVSSFGLSYLYKFPYSNSIMQKLIGNHTNNDMDLAESIFGMSRKVDNEQISLKGRVQFSHAKKTCNTQPLQSRYVLLGSPKASYYPIYLVQNGGKYKTLMDNNSILAGWKRYPVHSNFNHRCQGDSNTTTKITPLNQNSQFQSKVRFHNLTKVEIGAILSSLTFHNNSEELFHSLGMAKSYGYGKVKLKVTSLNNLQYSQEEYLKAFESAMNSELFDNQIQWHQSEQIKNLFSMAKPLFLFSPILFIIFRLFDNFLKSS